MTQTTKANAETVQPGFINRNQVKVLGPSAGERLNHPFARSIDMECQRCGHQFASNTCDCFQRKCPICSARQ